MSNEAYEYIDRLMQQARRGRVIERTTQIKFERPKTPDDELWRSNAIAALSTFESKATWAEVYIRCGRCKRGWDAWLAENPVTEPLDEWIAKAKSVVMEKRWI